jgi:hypothetical protein
MQSCDVNNKARDLNKLKQAAEEALKMLIQDSGGEDNANQGLLQKMRNEADQIDRDIEENTRNKVI